MDQRRRAVVACAAIVGIFVLVQLGALALVGPFESAGYQAVDDPGDPTNSVVYLVLLLVMTGVLLLVIKLGVEWFLRLLLVGASVYIGLFVFWILVPPLVTVPVDGLAVNLLALAAAAVFGIALWVYPEWYVIDAAGVVMGAGAAALFGISFGVLPALVLLTVLAVYDAISVYGTKHMLTLASGVMDLKVPIVLVVPLSLSYSYLDADMPDPMAEEPAEPSEADQTAPAGRGDTGVDTDGVETAADGDGHEVENDRDSRDDEENRDGRDGESDREKVDGERDPDGEPDPLNRNALFIGLGDAVIPTVLVASAAFFAPESVETVDLLGLSTAFPALTAMIGTIVGLVILLWMVLQGRAHAGLPLLNGGAITGYLLGALASGLTLVQALGLESYV